MTTPVWTAVRAIQSRAPVGALDPVLHPSTVGARVEVTRRRYGPTDGTTGRHRVGQGKRPLTDTL